jgi:RNA polymerase sigma factor (sigma-70 family)
MRLSEEHYTLALKIGQKAARGYRGQYDPIVSAALWGLMKAEQSYRPEKNPNRGAWAVLCIKSAVRDEIRQIRLQRGRTRRLTPEVDVPVAESESARDQAEAFETLCRRAPSARHAEVLRLSYATDLPQSAIARRLGLAQSRISVLHQQALKHLAQSR